jgi:DNA-binding response OmpR family regulator
MRVLVVEDHAPLARSIANGLREEGFAVDLTGLGEEGLRLAQGNPYDCIVLDVMLPDRDGWSVLQSLRDAGGKAPVLLLTARDAIEDRVKGLNLGADDYLVKPFAWEELVARVRALVRRSHGQVSSLLQIADLEIDTTARVVRRGGIPVMLTAKEYALLEYLAHHAGQVVSRGEIWDHLYDQADEASSNVVDVYIGYLRNKIDRDHPLKLIQTRRGMGYSLVAASSVTEDPES